MDQRVIDLYNVYIHGNMPRRDFLQRLAGIAGSAAAASALLPLIECNYATAAQVPADHAELETGYASYAGQRGKVRAYVAKPKAAKKPLPGVLVIHENRGLNAHIEDVARRAALAGFLAVAPDGLSAAGGAPEDQEKARDLFGATDRAVIDADVVAGVGYFAERKDCSGKIGVVGFCYGGGMALQCAAEKPDLGAAVAFYGAALPPEKIDEVKAPLMMHYAGKDERIDAGIADFRAALDAHEIAYSLNMYPGTQHGFHNDTSAGRYDATAAKLAWARTIAFFDHYLKA
ncbi:MAG TPA: dienelactone hydrolase family protein [Rhodanobacteraceae bacterium]|nr:dienelactone hydrolase family protein [Rhodanobacteraceae bacterium]